MDYLGIRVWIDSRLCFRTVLIPRVSLAYNFLMLTFAAAVFFLIITPGPGVLSTAGVGSGYGVRAATLYIGGLWLGNNLVALGVVRLEKVFVRAL